jgi:hypothetical protein
VRDFAINWTGTGTIENSGDAERLRLDAGEYMESEIVITGTVVVELLQNNYQAGDTVTLQYRHGADDTDCLAAAYQNYIAPFESLGYVQIKVSA